MSKPNFYTSPMKWSTHIKTQSDRQPGYALNSARLVGSPAASNFSPRKAYFGNISAFLSPKNDPQFTSEETLQKSLNNRSSYKDKMQKMVDDLKGEIISFGRFSRKQLGSSNSSVTITDLKQPDRFNKYKKTIESLQQKISKHSKNQQIKTMKSQQKTITAMISPQKKKVMQNTQKCKKLCLEIKKKLLKQTVSTTTTQKVKQSSQLNVSDFKLDRMVGAGKFSKVYRAIHLKTGAVFALKIIKKETIVRQKCQNQLMRQIKIQSFFNSPNIVKFYSFFHDQNNVYLLLEYCIGGQLYDLFKIRSKLSENQWAPIMKGICQGICQMHQKSVIHRDIKPQNIILSFGIPKLADLGWSVYSPHQGRQTFCGTPLYVSPELLKGHYNNQVDIWALGVMMYQFIVGCIPYNIDPDTKLTAMLNAKIRYPDNLSKDALNLLKSILQKNPETRIRIMDILQHPFLKTNAPNIFANAAPFRKS